jgi:hypothetical protein
VKGRYYFEQSVGERIMLKWILEKVDGRELTGVF